MIANFLTFGSGELFLPAIIGAAVADSLNPCAFSILFLSIAFLFSLGKDRGFILRAGGLYIFGIAFVYTLIGVGILKVLSVFSFPNPLAKIGAAILIAYAVISLINEFFPRFPIKLKIPEKSHEIIGRTIHKATLPAAFALGIVVGLFEFPCTGGPYLFALSLLHDQKTFWSGFGYLLLYNAIFVLPLIVILVVSANKTVLEKANRLRKLETKKARVALDLILVIIGLLMLAA
jgi:cytochrome c-type biogenesis protein